jgi:hypothetical protein
MYILEVWFKLVLRSNRKIPHGGTVLRYNRKIPHRGTVLRYNRKIP